MKAKIVRIGNSQGIRIPKPLLAEAGIGTEVDVTVVEEGLMLTAVDESDTGITLMLASRDSLSDWERPEEDAAWASLQ
jgi:antitoxin MazE